MSNSVHSKWMKMALDEAMKAYNNKEIPIGAIVVKNGRIIAEDSPKGLLSATGNPNATLEDSFIYFNSKESGGKNV